MERKLRGDQRGLTLVELLVSLAIAAVVALVVFGFMVIGAKTFTSTSSEVNLQHESQLAFNQMQDLIIDTALGVTYTYIENGGAFTGTEILIYPDDTDVADLPAGAVLQKDVPTDAAYKKIYMYNEDFVYVVVWRGANAAGSGAGDSNRLYYEEYAADKTATMGLGASVEQEQLMAEYVSFFAADLNDLAAKRIVRLQMQLDKNTQHYESSHNITIRNKIIINGKPGDIYTKDTPIPGEKIGSLTSPVVGPGDIYTFAKPANDAAGALKQEVRWYMDPSTPHHADTDIDPVSGRLRVSPSETNENFKVKVYLADGSDSREVTVNLLRITNVGLSLMTKNGKTSTEMQETEALRKQNYYLDDSGNITRLKLNAGDQFILQAGITGTNLNLLPIYIAEGYTDPTALEWKVTKGTTYVPGKSVAVNGRSCEFTMASSGIASKTEIEITAHSVRAAAIPYLTAAGGDDADSYTGIWSALTYQKDPDFYIVTDGNMKRSNSERAVFQISGGDQIHIYLYDVTLLEVERNSEGAVTKVLKTTEHWTEGVYNKGDENIAIIFPQNLNPYVDYRLLITCYEFNKWSGEWRKKYYLPYNNYDINNIDTTVEKPEESNKAGCRTGVSNTITADLYQSNLYFNGDMSCFTKTYIPRIFNDPVTIPQSDRYHYTFTLQNPYVTNMTGVQARDITWKLYQYTDNQYTEYADFYNMFEFSYQGDTNKIRLMREKWNDNVPSRLYLIPTIKTKNINGDVTTEWLMYKSYIEFINYNIKVPTEYTGTEPNIVESKYENMYFPYPTCYADTGVQFPGVTSSKATWYNSVGFSNELKYTITKSTDAATGIVYYYLELYRAPDLNTPFAKYRIAEDGKDWIRN